ncbi:MAG: glycosyltransferase family 2 protein [Bacteroidota bacterium]|nr:glycosyltransferase family 2 protein [Bacteroidota bacterium]
MNSKTKGISVIIPCYNREKTVGLSLDSVISQNYTGDVEIIVSDDGSTDGSIRVVESFGKKVMLLRKPADSTEQGVSGARNRGIMASTKDYVCFLDSDDYYLPGYLKKMVEVMEANPEAGYSFCRSRQEINRGDGKVMVTDWTRKRMSALDKKYHALYRGHDINTNTIFVRRTVLDSVGLFNVSLSNVEDTDMWIRISEHSKGIFVDIYGAVYRINHSNGQLTAVSQKVIRQCMGKVYAAAFQRYIVSGNDDKLRYMLIVRLFLYRGLTSRKGWFFYLFRLITVHFRLLCLFPRNYWRFLSEM